MGYHIFYIWRNQRKEIFCLYVNNDDFDHLFDCYRIGIENCTNKLKRLFDLPTDEDVSLLAEFLQLQTTGSYMIDCAFQYFFTDFITAGKIYQYQVCGKRGEDEDHELQQIAELISVQHLVQTGRHY